ncbi:MAG: HK97 family phage prohead protease [Armatimonadota bacterium]|nr:HK97 family phage prohead protease [Armatimonadota bacterium]MDR7400573.1 HK97 family phage prohead protease [Armatimonadota bacterium]MDR7410065.1 HK97 family phage prohead protease [Armatimonadota bacterium]MDR7465467.1 HK97 family phage prohead protease [Armatimonadota bacterium]
MVGELVRKQLEARVAPAGGDTYTFTITTRTPDRFGDVVEPSGIRWEAYMRNPVVLWAHNSDLPPIGRTVALEPLGDALVATVEFAQTPFAQEVRQLVDAGFLRAASIGFLPLRWEPMPGGGRRFLEAELVEWSVVPVPANPEALVQQAEAAGVVCRALREALSPLSAPALDLEALRAAVAEAVAEALREALPEAARR